MDDSLLWERWEEVDRLLDEALDLPPAERQAHVVRRTEGDPALRGLVMGLLGQLDTADDRLTGPSEALVLGAFSGEGDARTADLEPGTRVGRYVVGERRGRGGMATVYEAERSDGTYRQRVALKVLRRGLDTEDLIRRFVNERQILSSLGHPNIARLLDGGSLPDGRPYLVMELVDGVPITTYADERRLDLRSRLVLFLQVVDAVHAAHRRLVVHRDIKPSNILVDGDGRAKLLDFGIAKLLESETGGITEAGVRALTPDYASPEQVRGGPITTGTDVYQLGLLLRELLSGLPPLAGDTQPGAPPLRASRAAHLEPGADERAAARGTSATRLAKALGGELDLIIGTALRPDPEERYASADDLAEDLRAWLEGRPIRAHPESTSYRLRKFAGRHPFSVPGAAAFIIGLTAFVVMLGVQNEWVARQRDAAEAASRRALATQDFLVGLLRSPDPTGTTADAENRDVTVYDALQRGRARVATELAEQPEVRAAVLEAMGRSFMGLGHYETADTLLRESLVLSGDLTGPASAASLDLVHAIGLNHRMSRGFRTADSVLHEELRLRRAAGPVSDSVLAELLGLLSNTRREMGDIDSAVVLAEVAVDMQHAAGDTVGERFTDALGMLAYVLRGANRLDSAERVYRTVLRRQQQAPVRDLNGLAVTYNNLGYLFMTRGDLAEAESSYREAGRLAAQALGDSHPTTIMYGNNLAAVLELEGKLDEVEALAREAIAASEREWPKGHWRIGSAYAALGRFLLRQGKAAEAVAPLQNGAQWYERTLGPRHTWTLVAAAQLGAALMLAGETAKGGDLLDRAVSALHQHPVALDADGRLYLGRTAGLLAGSGYTRRAEAVRQLLAR